MRAGRPRTVLVVVALVPALVSASDPAGDVGPCRPSAPGPGDPPDLIGGTGSIVEDGTSARWDLRFAEPLVVPDRAGLPFRVDILIRDPSVPTVDVAYYRDLNRIVRYDAVLQQGVVILLLPERAQNVFLGGVVDGDTLTIQLPGRQITRDLDLQGVPIQDLTWTAVVRDEHRCDVLGSFRPHLPMVGPGVVTGAETPVPTPSGGASFSGSSSVRWSTVGWIALIVVLLLLVLGAWRFSGELRFRGTRRPPDPPGV